MKKNSLKNGMKMTLQSAMALSILGAQAIAAQGSGSTGGGTGIVTADRVVLADAFVDRQANAGTYSCKVGEKFQFSKALNQELLRAGHLMVAYGAIARKSESYPQRYSALGKTYFESEFVASEVSPWESDRMEYCLVDELPKDSVMVLQGLPGNARAEAVGYTEGKVTWLKKDLFLRMSLTEQVKTIIHERLHSFAGNVPHGPIADITEGLGLVLSLHHQQLAGSRPILTDLEVNQLERMIEQMTNLRISEKGKSELGKSGAAAYRVSKMGGGLVHSELWDQVSDQAYIGAGTVLGGKLSSVGAGSVLLNAQLCADGLGDRSSSYQVEPRAYVENSQIKNCNGAIQLGTDSVIANSLILVPTHFESRKKDQRFGAIKLEPYSRIIHSVLDGFDGLFLGAEASIEAWNVKGNDAPGMDEDSAAAYPRFELGAGATVKNASGWVFGKSKSSALPWNWRLNQYVPRIVFRAGAQAYFNGQFCRMPMFMVESGVHEVISAGDFEQQLCN